MDASAHLLPGHALRRKLQAQSGRYDRLGDLATVWRPASLNGTAVPPNQGFPFFRSSQLFELRPKPAKGFQPDRIRDSQRWFVRPGTILLARTGTGMVGRVVLARDVHANKLISRDPMRVKPLCPRQRGWIHAFLLAPATRDMMTAWCYGKDSGYIDLPHVADLPVPRVDEKTAADFEEDTRRIWRLRDDSLRFTVEAEALFARAVGKTFSPRHPEAESGFSIPFHHLKHGPRSLDAWRMHPLACCPWERSHDSRPSTAVAEAGFDIWQPDRYKRVAAPNGVPHWNGSDLLQTSLEPAKRCLDGAFGDPRYRGRVGPNWILLVAAGGTQGSLGASLLASNALRGHVVTSHVIRIVPRADATMPRGYLLTALSHPTLGLPRVRALAHGSVVQHIVVPDLARLRVVRLHPRREQAVADLAEKAAACRWQAALLEHQIAQRAQTILRDLAGSDP